MQMLQHNAKLCKSLIKTVLKTEKQRIWLMAPGSDATATCPVSAVLPANLTVLIRAVKQGCEVTRQRWQPSEKQPAGLHSGFRCMEVWLGSAERIKLLSSANAVLSEGKCVIIARPSEDPHKAPTQWHCCSKSWWFLTAFATPQMQN